MKNNINILNLSDDLIIYILKFCHKSKFNLLLTCKKINSLSLGKIKENRRGWLSYMMNRTLYSNALHHTISRNYIDLVKKIIYDLSVFTNFNVNYFDQDTINVCINHDRFFLYKYFLPGVDIPKFNFDL